MQHGMADDVIPWARAQINPGRVSYEKEGQTWVPLYRAGGRPASSSACWQLGPRRAWGFPSYLRPFQGPTGPVPACLRGHAAPRWTVALRLAAQHARVHDFDAIIFMVADQPFVEPHSYVSRI